MTSRSRVRTTRAVRVVLRLERPRQPKTRRLSFLSLINSYYGEFFSAGVCEMKPHASIAAILALLLCVSPLSMAQTDCKDFGKKIKDFEAEAKAKGYDNHPSTVVREANRKVLADLYDQWRACIDGKIKILTEMKNKVEGTNAAASLDKDLEVLRQKRADIETQLANNTSPQSPSLTSNAELTTGSDDTTATAQDNFPCLPGETYSDVPPLLTDILGKAGLDVVQGDFGGALPSVPQMLLYTTIDAASPTSSELLRGLEAYQYLSETARTDKQLGGAANSNAAVSAIEKPGFASLLGFAVEHGAINTKTEGR